MKRLMWAGLCALGLSVAGTASAQNVQVRWGASLYAGPSTNYPVVSYLRSGENVRLNGCLQDYAWCDVSDGGNRGWVDADNLAISRGGTSYTFYEASPWFTYPVTTFLLTDYWRRNYYSRPWYRDYNRYDRYDWRQSNHSWNHRPPVGPRPPGYRPPYDRPGTRPPGPPGYRPPGDHRPPVNRPPQVDRPGQPGWRPNDRPGQPNVRPNDRPGQPGNRPGGHPGSRPDAGQGPRPGNRPPLGNRPPPPSQGPRSGGQNRAPPSARPAQQER